MSSYILVPSDVAISDCWDSYISMASYNFYYNGSVRIYSYGEVGRVVLVGSSYLDYVSGETEEQLAERLFGSFCSEDYPALSLHGFSTAIIANGEHVGVLSDLDGYRSVYFKDSDNGRLFASKIHDFKSIDSVVCDLNQGDFYFSMVHGFYPGASTVYKDIHKSSAGLLYLARKKQCEVHKVLAGSPLGVGSGIENAIEELANHLESSIESLKSIDNKVAVLLGGFDSALVAAIAAKKGFEVETFSFYYEDNSFNQDKVSELCAMYGIRHHWVKIDAAVIKDGIDHYVEQFSQPTNWPNYIIQSNYLAKVISAKGFKICLTGDGCDGIFQGYPGIYKGARVYNERNFFAQLIGFAAGLIKSEFMERKLGHIYRLFFRVYRNSKLSNPRKTYLMYRIFDESTIARVFCAKEEEVLRSVSMTAEKVVKDISEESVMRLAYLGKSAMGPNRAKINGLIDSADLYVFSPYMHWRLKGFVSNLPEEFLRPRGVSETEEIGKYILTKTSQVKGYLSDEIIFQPKQSAVDAPIDDWYENELRDYLLGLLDHSEVVKNKEFAKALLGPKLSEKLYRKFFSSDAITSHAFSLLLTTILFEK